MAKLTSKEPRHRIDAERLRIIARGFSYNDPVQAETKHILFEIAMRLETRGYAPALPPVPFSINPMPKEN